MDKRERHVRTHTQLKSAMMGDGLLLSPAMVLGRLLDQTLGHN